MPGRPVGMAKKFEELEELAVQLSARIDILTPERSRTLNGSGPNDEIGKAWRVVDAKAFHLAMLMDQLGNLLREKAGITEPGPVYRFLTELEELQDTSAGGKKAVS